MQEAPEHPVKACQIHRGVPFVFQAEQGILSGRPKGAALLEALMAHLQLSQYNTAIALDFEQVQFVDVSCADEMLKKLLLRLRSGELKNRFVFIVSANASVRETVEAVLQLRDLAVLAEDGEGGVELLGALKTPMREALDVLLSENAPLLPKFQSRSIKTSISYATDSMPYSDSGWCADCATVPSWEGGDNTSMYQFSKRQFFWVCTWVVCAGLAVAQQLREGTLRVQESVENMRDAPNGRKVGTLLKGTEIEEISRDGKWVRFRIEGWIWGPSLEGFVEERPREEAAAAEPAPRLPLQDAMPRAKRLVNEEYGTFYGMHIDADLELLRIRLRVGDIGQERLRARQRVVMKAIWDLVGDELDEPITRVRIETNRADGSGAVGTVFAECPVETLDVEELSEEEWARTVRISDDGGQSWVDEP